jgi:hypothetical protein
LEGKQQRTSIHACDSQVHKCARRVPYYAFFSRHKKDTCPGRRRRRRPFLPGYCWLLLGGAALVPLHHDAAAVFNLSLFVMLGADGTTPALFHPGHTSCSSQHFVPPGMRYKGPKKVALVRKAIGRHHRTTMGLYDGAAPTGHNRHATYGLCEMGTSSIYLDKKTNDYSSFLLFHF